MTNDESVERRPVPCIVDLKDFLKEPERILKEAQDGTVFEIPDGDGGIYVTIAAPRKTAIERWRELKAAYREGAMAGIHDAAKSFSDRAKPMQSEAFAVAADVLREVLDER